MKILLLEDDMQLNITISNFLKSINYDVISLMDGETAIDIIDTIDFNLYIIDIYIPNISGLDMINYIRQKDISSPIIIITASLELDNFQTAFKNGCNEYIKKPFFLEELEIRIENLLNSSNKIKIIQISLNISYDMKYEELKIDNMIIKLRKKERKLLTILLQNKNSTVKIENIQNYVWENKIKESYPLRQLVSELKNKFPKDKRYIVSDIGIGYKFEL